ncbi:hypothetical protein [Streptomyces sp. NPDC054786]
MTEPIKSKYDPNPIKPGGGDGDHTPDPDRGEDFTDRIPEDTVVWTTPPSYNQKPGDWSQSGSSQNNSDKDAGDVAHLLADLTAMRETEVSMLSDARTAVAKYEEVREHTLAAKDNIFGQHATVEEKQSQNYTGPPTISEVDSPFAHSAQNFASHINPAMEKGLSQIGGILESLGEYIALINHSGQLYAQADRKANFPDPPNV